jgi:hypothetical protein
MKPGWQRRGGNQAEPKAIHSENREAAQGDEIAREPTVERFQSGWKRSDQWLGADHGSVSAAPVTEPQSVRRRFAPCMVGGAWAGMVRQAGLSVPARATPEQHGRL